MFSNKHARVKSALPFCQNTSRRFDTNLIAIKNPAVHGQRNIRAYYVVRIGTVKYNMYIVQVRTGTRSGKCTYVPIAAWFDLNEESFPPEKKWRD